MGDPVTPAVQVLDIRDGGPDLSYLDKLDPASAHRLGLPGRIVVVDTTGNLLVHHDRYQRLLSLPHVRAVVCVAVGPIDDGGRGISLRQSAAFRAGGVTLWVGDERGSRWAGGSARPEPVVDGPDVLSDLIGALSDGEVFDEVYETVRQVPYQTACPGLDIVRPPLDDADLLLVRREVLATLAEHSVPGLPPPAAPLPPRAGARLEPALDVVVPGSPLAKDRQALRQAVESAVTAAKAVARPSGLLRTGTGADTTRIHTAFDTRLARIDEMLTLMDGRQTGHSEAELSRLGVPAADPADHRRLAGQLRELVRTELTRGRSLRDLSANLRALANRNMAPDHQKFRGELASLHRHLAPARIRLRRSHWLAPAAALAVLTALCAGVVTALASWPGGAGVAVAGLVLSAAFAVRAPGLPPRAPLALLIGTSAAAAAGLLAGALPSRAGDGSPAGVLSVAAALAVLVAGASAAWHHTSAKWLAELRLAETREAVERVEALVEGKVAEHVRGVAHRRRLADAALALAADTGKLAGLYRARAGSQPAARGGSPSDVLPDLVPVLREDLISLVLQALEDHLTAVGTEATLTAAPENIVATAELELSEYEKFLATHGIYRTPPVVDKNGAREHLSLGFWQRSDAAARVLRTDGRTEFVQLCRIGDIRALDIAWRSVRVLRFAPETARRALRVAGDESVLTTESEVVGALRLVPLGAGRVVHEHPAATTDEGDGSLS